MSRHPAAARIARVLLGALFASMAASVLAVAAFRWLPVPTTAFMLAERQAARAEGKPLDQQHEWVPWERRLVLPKPKNPGSRPRWWGLPRA